MSVTSLVFLIAFFGGCLLAFARHPIFGLVTYVAVFYLHPQSRWWGASLPDLRWAMLAAVITALALLMQKRSPERIPLGRHGVIIGLLLFLAWAVVQLPWVLDTELQLEMLVLMAKYALLIWLIYECVDCEAHLRYFLWTHVLGGVYLGWIAYTSYRGGRFEDFGGPGIQEANAAGLQIVTAILTGVSLFLVGKWRDKAIVTAAMPLMVNALVTTISRSGFLAAVIGGIFFNLFAPKRIRGLVRVLSVMGVVLFLMLTSATYWARIGSLKHAGEEIEGMDTGSNRLVLIDAQLRMFEDHPLGCGHRCTAILSPQFLEKRYLDRGGRSSHNTFMTMLVEHGVPGAVMYLALIAWLARKLIPLARSFRGQDNLAAALFPAVAASLVAITIGDMFVDYLKLEVRIWFIAVLMIMVRMNAERKAETAPAGAQTAIATSKQDFRRRGMP